MDTHSIVTWNMNHRVATNDKAWHYVLDADGGLGADVALLQECTVPKWVADTHEVVWKKVWDKSNWGTAIVAADPSALVEIPLDGETSRYVTARVSLSGVDYFVASIHAATEPTVIPPLRQIFKSIGRDRGDRFIVGGDLNTGRSAEDVWPGFNHAEFWQELDDSGYVSCFAAEHGREALTYFHPTGRFRGQADHILVDRLSGSNSSFHCKVMEDNGLSDHRPLLVELTI